MRYLAIALSTLLCPFVSAHAQIGVNVDIGVNVSAYPELVLVPGYPVYYDPRADWNYFFYDGLYWVYQSDNWYASSWYNGPWERVDPEDVPLFVLRVPVRYYRRPPVYFRGWAAEAPPHWGEHWGRDWEARRSGWDRWETRSAPPAAPLPGYQRQYSGDRYPRAVQRQRSIQSENYHYQPHEAVTQRHIQPPGHPSSSRVEPQRRPPVEQRLPPEQQRVPQNQQRQQSPAKEPPTAQPVQSAQPKHQPPQRHPQTGPQDRGQEGRTEPQDRGRGRAPGAKDHSRKSESAPQDKSRERQNDDRGPGPR